MKIDDAIKKFIDGQDLTEEEAREVINESYRRFFIFTSC